MSRLVMVVAVGALALVESLAVAQTSEEEVSATIEGPGVKIGEGTVLHPILGAEAGVISNVFFEDDSGQTSALLRLIAELAVGSLPPERMGPQTETEQAATRSLGDFAFRADVHAEYEEYLSTNERVRAQRDLAFAAHAQGLVYPNRAWQFLFTDELRREVRPTNFESPQGLDRDINRLGLELRYQPRGRALSGSLRYRNVIDYFEDPDQQFANRLQHLAGLRVALQWLPMTRLYTDASLGFYGGLGSGSSRPSSMPLRVIAGIQTALTVKTTTSIRIGYGQGFYERGPDFANVLFGAQLGYRFSPQGRVTALYEYDFNDSINANFYRDHLIRVGYDQQVDRFLLKAAAEVRFRLYAGVDQIPEIMNPSSPNRNDLIISIPFQAIYNFRDSFAGTLTYMFALDQTDFTYGLPSDDPSYARHVLTAGVRAAL